MQPTTEPNQQPEVPKKTNRQWSAIGLRFLTSFIAMPIVLAFLWLGGWWTFAVVALVVLLCAYELHAMLLHSGYHPIMLISLGLSLLFLVGAMLPQQRLLLLEMGLGASLLLSFTWLFIRKNLDGAMVDWSLTLAIAIYLGWPMSFFPLLRGFDAGLTHGAWWVLMVLFGVWGFDTGAFFAGRFFGRHKLAPNISPGKTWEGVIGGMVLSITAALLFTVNPLGVPWYLAILLGILVGVAAVIGDLAESLIKRQTHVKDSGHIMPGHGGMLDRIDSLLFAVIVVYVFAQLIGKV